MIHTNCPYYCGDEDCNKCSVRGYFFSCAGCEEYEKDDIIPKNDNGGEK